MMKSEEEIRERIEYLEQSAQSAYNDYVKVRCNSQSQILKWALGDID